MLQNDNSKNNKNNFYKLGKEALSKVNSSDYNYLHIYLDGLDNPFDIQQKHIMYCKSKKEEQHA